MLYVKDRNKDKISYLISIISSIRRLKGSYKILSSILICIFFSISDVSLAYSAEKILLFGKMEFKGRIKTLPQWVKVLEKNAKNPIFSDDSQLNSKTTWGQFKQELSTLSKKEQLNKVNLFWNRWPYRLDNQVWKTPDYWAAPYEFKKNSGDCEDYAIAKYFTLKELGFSVDDMRIVVVMETIRNIAHAVLAVYLDNDVYILDNLSNAVLSHTKLRNYDAQYSVNEKYRWGHVKAKKK